MVRVPIAPGPMRDASFGDMLKREFGEVDPDLADSLAGQVPYLAILAGVVVAVITLGVVIAMGARSGAR